MQTGSLTLVWPCAAIWLSACAAALTLAQPAAALEFGLPAQCLLGEDCFIQQYPDMDSGSAAADPFCGNATYDGHSGTDLRVLSMRDVTRGVPVAAMADGKVLRVRDGEPDRLVRSKADRAAVADKECGNGVVIEHQEGYETQYCHMREDSLAVAPGDTVKRGDRLGEVGASGAAQFPHVHVTVRKDGNDIDPATGRTLGQGCAADASQAAPLFSPDVAETLTNGRSDLMAVGLAGEPVKHDALAVDGPPPAATATSPFTVGWGWFINLRGGDRIRFRILGPDGEVFAEQTTAPLERAKATYSAFAGRRVAPEPGAYEVTVGLLRDGETVIEKTKRVVVE
jgi:hypothetical protein